MSQRKTKAPAVQNGPDGGFVLQEFMPFQVTVLAKKLSQLIAEDYSTHYGISISEWRVLAMLSQYEEVTARQVTDETPMDKVAVSRAVGALVEKGLVRKRDSKTDGRAVLLRLSQRGKRIASEIQQIALRHEANTLSALSKNEQRVFSVLLQKLIARADGLTS